MTAPVSNRGESLFRTRAWTQAWIDVWGKDVELIDLGGRKDPREHVYLLSGRLKKIIPARLISLAGIGCGPLSTPRAEYNVLDQLASPTDGYAFFSDLDQMSWAQFILPDVPAGSQTDVMLTDAANRHGWNIDIQRENAYAIESKDFSGYCRSLGPNTRLRYFNRRRTLAKFGTVEFASLPIDKLDDFYRLLNEYHLLRWGQPCYSPRSQLFIRTFLTSVADEGGQYVLDVMQVNGRPVSVLLDVVWKGTRYNFQSGYLQDFLPKVALGAIHMGYAIEQAIRDGQIYDMMAGTGKNSNYKEGIANVVTPLVSYRMERGLVKALRQVQGLISKAS